jgi:hypothetical protein
MSTPHETILTALHARLLMLPATALRGEVLPERIPPEGLMILRDGEPGEPEVKAWLDKHPRLKLHFTPTSASWLNLVERFFAEITTRRIRRGSYSSVDDLEAAIYDYLAHHNERPKPFKWTKTAEDILTRERRALNRLDEI